MITGPTALPVEQTQMECHFYRFGRHAWFGESRNATARRASNPTRSKSVEWRRPQ
jgi:hypothetical protein